MNLRQKGSDSDIMLFMCYLCPMKRMQNKEIGFKKQRICIGIDAQRRFALLQLKKEDAFLRIVFFFREMGAGWEEMHIFMT